MRAIRMVAWAEIRQRWGSIVVLTLLVGFVGTVVIASAAGARRTASSLTVRGGQPSADVEINAGFATTEQLAAFRARPRASPRSRCSASSRSWPPTARSSRSRGSSTTASGGRSIARGSITGRRAARGRRADHRREPGDRYRPRRSATASSSASYTPEQFRRDRPGAMTPEGPALLVRGGRHRPPAARSRRPGRQGRRRSCPPQAFTREHLDEIGSFSGDVLRVRTRDGAADVPEVVKSARRIFGGSEDFSVTGLGIEGQGARERDRRHDLRAVGARRHRGLAGLVAIGLALARQMAHAVAGPGRVARARARPAAAGGGGGMRAVPSRSSAARWSRWSARRWRRRSSRSAWPARRSPIVGVDVDGLGRCSGFVGMVAWLSLLDALAAVSW